MALPFFYIDQYDSSKTEIILDEDTSRHIIQVLRMKRGELLSLTDGNGNLFTTSIADDHKKHCVVNIQEKSYREQAQRKISIAISLLKNANRFEWFLEKATEIGVNEIIPLICHRTEKEKFRHDRLKSILVSAMLQSQQCWLPVLHEPIAYELLFRQEEVAKASQKFIAHCIENEKRNLVDLVNETLPSQIILIGPEGDFTEQEIDMAIAHHFDAVALGETRLRAETAGVVAATILRMR
ncbi:RsmE family RNA methyltransferase [Terrimonas alba]|uniref:RsmE family RNA methyltransferase n=1 Tax=Terrimonas alba TaxID=3349636 RepID=UPI0035F422BD